MALNKIWQATRCVLALAFLTTALCAEPISQLKPTGYVNDFAGVLDASSSESIRNICQQIDEKTKAQIAIVTIHSLDGADIESYASSLYKAWGIGPKSSNRGVLILLAINDRKRRIEVGYGLEPILPDGKVGGFGREIVPLLQQGQYGPALLLLTQRIANVIAADAGVQLQGADAPPSTGRYPKCSGYSTAVGRHPAGNNYSAECPLRIVQGRRRRPDLVLARHVHEQRRPK